VLLEAHSPLSGTRIIRSVTLDASYDSFNVDEADTRLSGAILYGEADTRLKDNKAIKLVNRRYGFIWFLLIITLTNVVFSNEKHYISHWRIKVYQPVG
jgi:hypothetical protein